MLNLALKNEIHTLRQLINKNRKGVNLTFIARKKLK